MEKFPFFVVLIPTPDFPPFLLYVRCKCGVTFVRRCFRDEEQVQSEVKPLHTASASKVLPITGMVHVVFYPDFNFKCDTTGLSGV